MTAIRDMLTENEAKRKWCGYQPRVVFNRGEDAIIETVYPEVRCLGSECMFWRWSHQVQGDDPTGFCGAAGLPKYL